MTFLVDGVEFPKPCFARRIAEFAPTIIRRPFFLIKNTAARRARLTDESLLLS